MSVRDEVLRALENRRGEYVSGGELAKSMYVSRNAVWKAIKQLRSEGYDIDAVTNKGYRLSGVNSILSRQSIEKYLTTEGLNIEVYKSLTSTNTYLKKIAEEGASEGSVVTAEEQTEGRGRFGRKFYSPGGSGIYVSILLRPRLNASQSLLITTCAAVAVSKAIERVTGQKTDIKWVNDVYIGDKKVCGILTEASVDMESGGLNYAILGIGINIFPPESQFPDEIKNIAAAIFDSEQNEDDYRSRLIAAVLDEFMAYYPELDKKKYLAYYRERSLVIGRQIKVIKGDKTLDATALEIDGDVRLKVRYNDGSVEYLSSGEVSIKIN